MAGNPTGAPKAGGISEAALKIFANNFKVYGDVCLKIRTKQAELIPFDMNESQDLVHEVLAEQYRKTGRVRAIILKARQQGMSTYTSGRFFRKLHLWPNHRAVVIADELDRAQNLFVMYDLYHDHLPDEVKPMKRYGTKKKELFFDNPKDAERGNQPGLGSGISVETAGDTAAGRGSTIQLAHLSEMAFWPNALDVYISMIQAVPDKGSEVIVESTANGVGNLFHQMWEQAVQGQNGYIAIFIPWWFSKEYAVKLTKSEKKYIEETLDEYEKYCLNEGFDTTGWAGFGKGKTRLTLEQLAWRRQTIREKLHGDERIFRQEYPATPEEAFIASGSCFFDEEALGEHRKKAVEPRRRAMLVSTPGQGVLVRPSELGYLRLWTRPGEDDEEHSRVKSRYIIAADTASGRQVAAHDASLSDPNNERGGRDFSSADVIDVVRRKQVAQLHGRMAPEIFADQLNLLGRLYSGEERTGLRRPALVAVERNHASGETVLRLLKDKYMYPNLYYARSIAKRFDRRGDRLGWMTTVETRMPMLDNLAQLVRDHGLLIPNKDSIKEMFTFVRGEDGKPQAQEGAHDDRVISLAIAAYLMETTSFEEPKNYDAEQLVEVGNSGSGWFNY